MVHIMAMFHIAEARIMFAGSRATLPDVRMTYLREVLAHANVDTTRFLRSFDFYANKPALFASMYEDVIVDISKQQAEARKQNKKP